MAKPLDFRKPHMLRNDAEYEAAVEAIDRLLDLDPEPGTEGHERFVFLSVLVQAYEEQHVSLEAATPQEVVDFMLEQRGMIRADLTELMGGRSRVSEFFSRKRPLSLGQIQALREAFGIPADVLIEGPKVV